eukprot:1622433-Alexandrium_andersonii.AAC.1
MSCACSNAESTGRRPCCRARTLCPGALMPWPLGGLSCGGGAVILGSAGASISTSLSGATGAGAC